jgi:hypothetical protein
MLYLGPSDAAAEILLGTGSAVINIAGEETDTRGFARASRVDALVRGNLRRSVLEKVKVTSGIQDQIVGAAIQGVEVDGGKWLREIGGRSGSEREIAQGILPGGKEGDTAFSYAANETKRVMRVSATGIRLGPGYDVSVADKSQGVSSFMSELILNTATDVEALQNT